MEPLLEPDTVGCGGSQPIPARIAAGLVLYGDGICDLSVATRASALSIADDSSLNTE
jgi:hypothetical protein